MRYHFAALGRRCRCGHGQAVGLARIFRILLDSPGQLLHRGRGFFQRTCLLFGAGRQVEVAAGNLDGGSGDGFGAAAHFGYDAHQACVHVLQRLQQLTGLVTRVHVDAAGQIAGGNRLCDLHRLPQRPHNRARDRPGKAGADQQR